MILTALEEELLKELRDGSRGLWELFEFVSLHAPVASDAEVLAMGRDLVETWKSRGWLQVTDQMGERAQGLDLLEVIDAFGASALMPSPTAPWLALTPKAHADAG